jgi:hypothetical protein
MRILRRREGALDEPGQVALEPSDQVASLLELAGRGPGLLETAQLGDLSA